MCISNSNFIYGLLGKVIGDDCVASLDKSEKSHDGSSKVVTAL